MCGHNWDSIEICSAQQARAGGELLYTESRHFGAHASWRARWARTGRYTKSATSCWSHITMCRSQYHGVLRGSRLLGLEQPASAFCYRKTMFFFIFSINLILISIYNNIQCLFFMMLNYLNICFFVKNQFANKLNT